MPFDRGDSHLGIKGGKKIDMERVAGIVLLVGSVLFCVAAFSPISRVYAERDAEKRIEIIEAGPGQWTLSQLLFALGATIAVIGLSLAAYHLRSSSAALAAYVGVVLLIIGVVFWDWHLYVRIVDPEGFARGTILRWPFVVYSILTQFGLIAFGVAYLGGGYPRWLGWTTIAATGALFILLLIFKDMPPFVYYIITILAGVVMVI